MPKKRQSHIGCICFVFLHCEFSNVSLKRPPEKRQSYIGYICFTCLHCAFSKVSSNCLSEKMHSHTGCICLTFLHCVFSNVSSNYLYERIHDYTGCTGLLISPHYMSLLLEPFHWPCLCCCLVQDFGPSPAYNNTCILRSPPFKLREKNKITNLHWIWKQQVKVKFIPCILRSAFFGIDIASSVTIQCIGL